MPTRILRNLTLNAIAAVDDPCQEHAKAAIIKRRDPPADPPGASALAKSVAKYIGSDDGAHSFAEVLAENKFDQAIWPMTDALSQSIRSIMGDTGLTPADRDQKITASVDEFLAAVRRLDPAEVGGEEPIEKVERQLRELIRKKEPSMKTVEQLQAEIDTLKGQIGTLTTERDNAIAAKGAAESAKAAAEGERDTAKAALAEATDETIKVGDREVKKSKIGEDTFAIVKAQEERAELAVLEKRAATDYAHVPGTDSEKALVLKAAGGMSEEARKAFDTILGAAERMAKAGFDRIGYGGDVEPTLKAAQATFTAKVKEIAKRDSVPEFEAMKTARTECPAEFAAAYPEQAGAN